jgi:hypothetical protein
MARLPHRSDTQSSQFLACFSAFCFSALKRCAQRCITEGINYCRVCLPLYAGPSLEPATCQYRIDMSNGHSR